MQNDQQSSELEMQRKGRMVLLLMLIFFVVPLVVVMTMYKLNWMPNGSSVGELVRPARLLSASGDLKNNEGVLLSSQFWKERWSVVYIAADCEKVCFDKLHDMRQLYVSLYKDMPRVQRVLITTTQDVKKIRLDYPDLIVINQPKGSLSNFTKQFQMNGEAVSTSNRLYLVDPLGYLMMSYRPELPLVAVRKDVTRLLRFSWAG